MTEYAELHCHSYFSLLDGVSSPEALVARAAELEMPALALTDHDALYGAVAFWRAAGAAGVKPVFGVEITLGESLPHPTLRSLPGGESPLTPTLSQRERESGVRLPSPRRGDGLGVRDGRSTT
jgi:DNA polymerase III alpha subunit